jgi:hypothetical protein
MNSYIIQLIIAYTCVGVFVATAVITILALVGIIKIESGYMQRLFEIVIVEIVVVCVGFFAGLLKLDPAPIQTQLVQGERAEQVLTQIETGPTSQLPTTTVPAEPELPPRVYIHIADENQRASAQTAQAKLREAGELVPGIENVGDKSPQATELRYFKLEEAALADEITATLSAAGISAPARFIPGFENAKIRPNHFELWFGKT